MLNCYNSLAWVAVVLRRGTSPQRGKFLCQSAQSYRRDILKNAIRRYTLCNFLINIPGRTMKKWNAQKCEKSLPCWVYSSGHHCEFSKHLTVFIKQQIMIAFFSMVPNRVTSVRFSLNSRSVFLNWFPKGRDESIKLKNGVNETKWYYLPVSGLSVFILCFISNKQYYGKMLAYPIEGYITELLIVLPSRFCCDYLKQLAHPLFFRTL